MRDSKMKQVIVIGAGPGDVSLLTGKAKQEIERCDLVVATGRLFELFKNLHKNCVCVTLSEIENVVLSQPDGAKIAILASGDVGFYSISSILQKSLPDCGLRFLNGISSLQYLCAKLGIAYEGIKTVSVHGRDASALPFVCYHRLVFVLTGGVQKAHDVLREFALSGLGKVRVTAGENLSSENERILCGTAEELQNERFSDLTVLLIEHPDFADRHVFLRDESFTRGPKIPMTKESVRNLCLATLNILPADVVWDIGAGTGSVSCAMACRAYESFVYAVEQKEDAFSLLMENRQKLGAYNIVAVQGKAPDALLKLPAPDKVFIGGSGGNLNSIFEAVLGKNPSAKILLTAATLETLTEATDCFAQYGMTPDVLCLNVSQAQPLGGYRLMQAQNPVYLMGGQRHE